METKRNITPEEVEKTYRNEKKPVATTVFDAKNYLNTKLKKGEIEKSLKIRLLTIDNQTNAPFKHIYMHTIMVPPEISESGWKSYVCLEKTSGKFTEKLGTKCPFCEANREYYKKMEEAKSAGDLKAAEEAKKMSVAFKAKEHGVLRCIERGKEEEGPKFWKFALRSDKKDPESVILKLYKDRVEECQEEGTEPENILDVDYGRDLKVTIERVMDTAGKPTNKTSIDIKTFGQPKPLSDDEEKMNEWLDDAKIWSDVFVAKPYDYLSIVKDGQVPWFNKNEGKWVPRQDFNKQNETPADIPADELDF